MQQIEPGEPSRDNVLVIGVIIKQADNKDWELGDWGEDYCDRGGNWDETWETKPPDTSLGSSPIASTLIS